MGYGVSARGECRSGRPDSSLSTHHAGGANDIGLWRRLVLRQMRRGLASTLGNSELAFVVMQFDHEEKVQLRHEGSSRQESAELALMMG